MTRCNCDASCGENRYHDVGDAGCRFRSEEEYDSYWRNRRTPWMQEEYEKNLKIQKTVLSEPTRRFSDNYTEEKQPLKEYTDSMVRPWGEWHVLDIDRGYKVKRLHILPDQSISLQYHNHRSEHWTIVQGEGKVIVDGNIFKVSKGESFHVPRMAMHKVTNTHLTETLIAIEVQMGEICSEDDIVRC